MIDLLEEPDEAQEQIKELKSTDWLDLYTRAVLVEFTVYNANVNLFSNVILMFEMPSTGGILNLFFVQPFRVYRDSGLSVLLCQLICIVVFIYYLVSLVKLFRKSRPRMDFFKSVVNVTEMLHIGLGLGAISLFFIKNVQTSSAVAKVFEAKGELVNIASSKI